MKKEFKKNIKTAGKLVFGVVIVCAAGAATYVGFNKPAKVTNPCHRTYFRADGKPKVAFNSAHSANLQSLKQFVRYGEVCNVYQAPNGKFYTGHSKNAVVRNINPFN